MYFYPRSPCGERLVREPAAGRDNKFLSTLSLRRATETRSKRIDRDIAFLSTLSLRRATDGATHYSYIRKYFYPRSPCGERLNAHLYYHSRGLFLSTLSLRRATIINRNSNFNQKFLSTLSLRRATYLINTYHRIFGISIHALLAESDVKIMIVSSGLKHFYPRSPCGERPTVLTLICDVIAISIHALLAESDISAKRETREPIDFYPRSPCGERQPGERHANNRQEFLSTLSLRRATSC